MGESGVWRALSPRQLIAVQNDEISKFSGKGVTFLQVEFDLFEDHECFHQRKINWPAASPRARERFYESIRHTVHATATASIVVDSRFGVAPEVDFHFHGCSSLAEWNGGLRAMIHNLQRSMRKTKFLSPGDIISISLQFPMVLNERKIAVPVDFDDHIRESLNEISDEFGVLIFLAAGNSAVDLDKLSFETWYDYAQSRENSSSILVGYCSNDLKDTMYSNYGTVVDVYAPAESIQAACYNYSCPFGIGDLLDTKSYGFQRTSAATPIVAGFAASIQGAYPNKRARLSPPQFRELLKNKADRKIGSQPVLTSDLCREIRRSIG
jgi:hypothetical protein